MFPLTARLITAPPAADIAAVNRIVAMGNDAEEELPRLRRQYRNLDISSWDKENRLQTK